MNLPFQPTFNSIVMILIGLAMIVLAVYLAFTAGGRFFAVGFFFTGVGNILFGATNGFMDMTPMGGKLFRIGLGAYAIGIPVIAYFVYRQL